MSSPSNDRSGLVVSVALWDLPIRLFHWLLVLFVAISATTGLLADEIGSQGMEWHKRSGYCILTLVLFRIFWGVAGGTTARFASFVRGPGAVLRYASALFGRGTAEPYVGHNPLGGWSVVLMLLSLATQTTTGLFVADEDLGVEGPLAQLVSNRISDRMAAVHEVSFYILMTLIAIHVLAILFYLIAKRDNLIRPMLSGRKELVAQPGSAATGGSLTLAAVLLMVAIGVVYAIAR